MPRILIVIRKFQLEEKMRDSVPRKSCVAVEVRRTVLVVDHSLSSICQGLQCVDVYLNIPHTPLFFLFTGGSLPLHVEIKIRLILTKLRSTFPSVIPRARILTLMAATSVFPTIATYVIL
jgi:hypothetical protein